MRGRGRTSRFRAARLAYDIVMPIQNAAVSTPVRSSIRRRRFLRTATTMTAMPQSRKPSSGQNNRALKTVLECAALSVSQDEAYDAAAVSEAAIAPASAIPLAHSGITQFRLASRQSNQVCAITSPTTTKTNSAIKAPKLACTRLEYFRVWRSFIPAGRMNRFPISSRNSARAAAVETPSGYGDPCLGPPCCVDRHLCLVPLLLHFFFRQALQHRLNYTAAFWCHSQVPHGALPFREKIRPAVGLRRIELVFDDHPFAQNSGLGETLD